MRQTKARLIIDCQLLQTSDKKRGMGLFLSSLLTGLVSSHKTVVDYVFITNPRLPAIDGSERMLLDSFGGVELAVDLLCRKDRELFSEAADTNRAALDSALSTLSTGSKDEKTVFFIPAQFSSEIFPVFPTSGTVNVMLFHDAIPFLYHKQYFADHEGAARKDYAQRFREVYRTDHFVTNSQTTADDLTVYFGIDPSRITAIYGAGADRTKLKPQAPAYAADLAQGYIFMPSGDDRRKNNELAVMAFAALGTNDKLVITSRFSEGSERSLRALSPNVVFPGSVSDAEFLWLTDNARAVFFPTLYEGLGMPALEAIERGAIVACSQIPVFAEISPEAFFYFDPKSTSDMTRALKQVLAYSPDAQEIKEKKKLYPAVLKRFSWALTAQRFIDALDQVVPAGPRKKLAVFCPSPSSYSAVGKFAQEVHGELSRWFDIDYFAEAGLTSFDPTRPNLLEYAANYYPAASFKLQQQKYDHVLYHIGNSEFHIETIFTALRLPANAIIHDTRLDGIFDYMTREGFMAVERREFETVLDDVFKNTDSRCTTSIVTNQQTAVCHSAYAKRALDNIVSDGMPQICKAMHPIGVPAIKPQRSGGPVVSFAGIISEDKGIGLVAEVSKLENTRVKVFGFGVLGDSPLLRDLADNVEVLKDLTDKDFQDLMAMSDILVNYRPNYHGETSRSTLEAMRFGTVVIVKDVGWYGELPDATVVKVKNERDIITAIRELIAEPERVKQISNAARAFLSEHYTYREYAERLVEAMEGKQ